ncbi:MAG: hypothetical protein KKB20_17720, partial [Proteobacteria bacterium]|nr:hypothetical protein [Pseudomonadota bacterium]
LKVSLDPWKIRLASPDGPAPNGWIDGRIMQITDEGGHVRALIDVGLPLAVLIDGPAYQASGFMAGGRARVYCPPEAVEVV